MSEIINKNDIIGDEITNTASFIHSYIQKDLGGDGSKIVTRFPPEPNGYLHIGHAKSICFNFGVANYYNGKYNLRFDDTNPAKEDEEFVNSQIEDIEWLGFPVRDRIHYGSDYFQFIYEAAVKLIKDGKAFVCDLSAEEMRVYRGTLTEPGKNSPYRDRSVEENLELFEKMKNGEFKEGEKTLRAKIDMSSANINMRDPIIYRISYTSHYKTGDNWKIYPMYDFAHPLQDAIEKITHSICSLEFEDHRPLYDWVVDQFDFEIHPRQIEFAKLQLTNTIMGKRYLRKLVEEGKVDGWDDPRMSTISGFRRRGCTPSCIRTFLDKIGFSKANNTVDYAFLEFCLREDIKLKSKVVMTVFDPIKVIITNYPENQTEMLTVENNPENPELGEREIPFSREIFIERDDFMENAPNKFFRLTVGKEVRLKGAYFIQCNEVVKDEQGNIVELHCTYDPATKSGLNFTERKVKGTIHWVNCKTAVPIKAMLYDSLIIDDDSEQGYHANPNSLIVMDKAVSEPSIKNATLEDRFQFIRNGYYCLDCKCNKDEMVFNRIVPLKSSYKPS